MKIVYHFLNTKYLCNFTAKIHIQKFKMLFCSHTPILNATFKGFLYTKINQTQIWYGDFNYTHSRPKIPQNDINFKS